MPFRFEPNEGQTDPRVRYFARTPGITAFLTDDGVTLLVTRTDGKPCVGDPRPRMAGCPSFEHAAFRMNLTGADRRPRIRPSEPLPGRVNYFLGNDPSRWRTDVTTFAKVEYGDVYPGIDLVFYGNGRNLEYDFVVKPGGDPGLIELAFEGVQRLRNDANGDLVLTTAAGEVRQHRPRVFQQIGGSEVEIAAGYRIREHTVRFELARYDRSRTLRIDPVLAWSTYLGGDAFGSGIAVDASGAVYVTGSVISAAFPIVSAYQTFQGANDIFVAKINPAGSQLVYSTFLGSNGDDVGKAIAVDGSGAAYVLGQTFTSTFPTKDPYQTFRGSPDVVVTKLSPAGSSLIYSTYLGGSGADDPGSIAIGPLGSAYITGGTKSSDFPAVNAYRGQHSGGSDAFVTRLNSAGTNAVYSTFLGGTGTDSGQGIAVDGAGAAYVTGSTAGGGFPLKNAVRGFSGVIDAFITKVSPFGNDVTYSTMLGGGDEDYGTAIAIDSSGAAYVTGYTQSFDYPATTLFKFYQAGTEVFVAKLNGAGTEFVYSTFVTGANHDYGLGIAVDNQGNAFVAGQDSSYNFPLVQPLQDFGGESDAFVLKLNPTGTALVDSTHLGGRGGEIATAIAIDPSGFDAYITGANNGGDFPIVNPIQANPGNQAAVIARITELVSVTIDSTLPGRQFTVAGGAGCAAGTHLTPKTILWAQGVSCTVQFDPNQPAPAGTRYVFDGWQGAEPSVGPAAPATYVGRFRTQYLLTRTVTPANAGTITATPASTDGYYDAATLVQLQAVAGAGWSFAGFSGSVTGGASAASVTMSAARTVTATFTAVPLGGGGQRFVPVTPCRIMDTRAGQGTSGSFGPPALAAGGIRTVPIPTSPCGIPAAAQAYSLNITVVPASTLSYLTIWPTGQPQPFVSTLNSFQGEIVANAAIVPAGTNGAVNVFVTDASDVIIDINGYFAPPQSGGVLQFYPVAPCRVADTRAGSGKTGAFGAPRLNGGESRGFPIPTSGCGVPASAQAYSVNVTVVPASALGYLTLWPTGSNRPLVSTLNSFAGAIVANAALVPAGTGGAVSAFVSDASDVIVDINGYFAPPAAGGLNFAPVVPCRVADTRTSSGFSGAFGAPTPAANSTRTMSIPSSICGISSAARAYAFNVTVVPAGVLSYLTSFPAGQSLPLVSTLNSFRGYIVANAAIVPAGAGAGVSFFVTDPTDLVVDINGYFSQ